MSTIVEHKQTMNNLAELIQQEESCVPQIYDSAQIPAKMEILEIARKKTGEEFVVLIIGAFSSGKSSMINALIGEELLPTGFLPETAVIGELHYGEKKKIVLYPKKGQWKSGDEPFEISPDEIVKYVSLSDDDAINRMETTAEGEDSSKIDAKFEKMIVYWPLNILKDGVILVDSPGINDPNSNDYIVNGYLPNADAIVYVMDSQHAYQNTDGNQLQGINELGRKNIITGYTFYDIIIRQIKNQKKLQEFRTKLINYILRNGHTELGEDSIHFLDSLSGIRAREKGDAEGWMRSGFKGFEDYLGNYLVEGKGRTQIENMVATIAIQADEMTRDAEVKNSASKKDVTEILSRIEEANRQLQEIRDKSFQTGKMFRLQLESYIPKVQQMVETFISKSLPALIDLNGFQTNTQLPTGISKLNPVANHNKASAIQQECKDEIRRRLNIVYRKWTNDTLNEFLNNAVKSSTKEIEVDLKKIAQDLKGVTETISGFKSSDDSLSNVALGVGFALLTGDVVTGSMSAVYGKRAMGRVLLFQAGAGVAMAGMAAVGVAITLPIFIGGVIIADILALLTSDNKGKLQRLREKAVDDFRKSFSAPESKVEYEKMIACTMDNVKKFIEATCSAMEKALAEDLDNAEKQKQAVLEESKLNQSQKNAQIARRNESVRKLAEIKTQALEIGKSYGDAAGGI